VLSNLLDEFTNISKHTKLRERKRRGRRKRL